MGSVQTPRAPRIGALRAAAGALTSPATLRAALRFVGTVARDFFWLQFSVKLGIRKIKIINVDHELDARIPFRPEKIGAYLDFIAFWIRPPWAGSPATTALAPSPTTPWPTCA